MKFDAKAKRRITNDWVEQFPSLQLWKPTRIVRRNGPLIVGICLDRDSEGDNYTPIGHIHSLCIPFPIISLDMAAKYAKNSVAIRVKVVHHAEKFMAAVEAMKCQYPFLTKENLEFNDLIEVAVRFHEINKGKVPAFNLGSYNSIITAAAYLGEKNYAINLLNRKYVEMSKWPKESFNIIGSAEKWRSELLELIENPSILMNNVKNEITKHKLEGIVDRGFVLSQNPRFLP